MSFREKQDLTPPSAIVPAAGSASRFGGGKLVADIRGEPLLTHSLRCLLNGGVGRVVLVVAPGVDLGVVALLSDPRVQVVFNPDPSRGMFSSIQAGMASADRPAVTLVLPGDMPFVQASTVRTVIEAATRAPAIVAPTHRGRRGHPIALPPRVVEAVVSAAVDRNLKSVLAAMDALRVDIPVEDEGVLRDVDVREDLRNLGLEDLKT